MMNARASGLQTRPRGSTQTYAGRGPAIDTEVGAAATPSGQRFRGGGVRPKGWHCRRGVRRHGDTPAPPQLRVGYLNIDGLTATKVAAVVQRLRPGGLHVLLLAETKLTQASQREMNTLITLASRGRVKLYCRSRAGDSHVGAHAVRQGGVAALVLSSIAVTPWARRGMAGEGDNATEDVLGLSLRAPDSGAAVLDVVVSYLAPSLPEEEAHERLEALGEAISVRPGHVVIGLDANARIAGVYDHPVGKYTSTDRCSATAMHTTPFVEFLHLNALVPVHGTSTVSRAPAAATNISWPALLRRDAATAADGADTRNDVGDGESGGTAAGTSVVDYLLVREAGAAALVTAVWRPRVSTNLS